MAQREGLDWSRYEHVLKFKNEGGGAVASTLKVENVGDDQEVRSSLTSCPQDICVGNVVARVSNPLPKSGNR